MTDEEDDKNSSDFNRTHAVQILLFVRNLTLQA